MAERMEVLCMGKNVNRHSRSRKHVHASRSHKNVHASRLNANGSIVLDKLFFVFLVGK